MESKTKLLVVCPRCNDIYVPCEIDHGTCSRCEILRRKYLIGELGHRKRHVKQIGTPLPADA
jgi:hypothetical protein